jgi:hypothetical protein
MPGIIFAFLDSRASPAVFTPFIGRLAVGMIRSNDFGFPAEFLIAYSAINDFLIAPRFCATGSNFIFP